MLLDLECIVEAFESFTTTASQNQKVEAEKKAADKVAADAIRNAALGKWQAARKNKESETLDDPDATCAMEASTIDLLDDDMDDEMVSSPAAKKLCPSQSLSSMESSKSNLTNRFSLDGLNDIKMLLLHQEDQKVSIQKYRDNKIKLKEKEVQLEEKKLELEAKRIEAETNERRAFAQLVAAMASNYATISNAINNNTNNNVSNNNKTTE